jgi:S1-C subfamily serine protease
MSDKKQDNNDFEFIKEQVIVKKYKKFKKWILPFLMTVLMAVLFGIIAAATFCITEPRLYKLLHRENQNKTPVTFPTIDPEDEKGPDTEEPDTITKDKDEEKPAKEQTEADVQQPKPVIVEKSIEADINDYITMYDDIKSIAYNSSKSIVKVSSIIKEKDWFGNPVEREVKTTGLVIADMNGELLILVSLDRVKDANSIAVVFTDTIQANAVLQDYESEINLAVISVNRADVPEIFMNSITVATLGESYSIANGTPIIALGSPNGHPGSMEVGMITSRGSSVSITDNRLDLFNTDIINNENSDGVIVNLKGEVIGIMTRTLKEDMNEELSAAIGISKLKSVIQRMANKDPKIYFGIKTEDMTDTAKRKHEVENGIYVEAVKANSPAFAAGIKNGDIILEVDSQTVVSTNRFYDIISECKPGQTVSVKIKRTSTSAEKNMDIKVTLTEKSKSD